MPTTQAGQLNRTIDGTAPALRQCRLCGSPELTFEFGVDGCALEQCVQCGQLFLNPQPPLATPPAHEANAETLGAGVYELHTANAVSRLDDLLSYAFNDIRRLLVVANDEFLVGEARRRGLDVVSLTSPAVEAGSLTELPNVTLDAVVFQCTLERLRDPEAALAQVRQRLKPGGAMMVIAPTIDSRTARLFRSTWWEFNRRNLHYFSADTLQSLLLKNGFGDPIIEMDGTAVSLEYFRARIGDVPSALTRRSLTLLVSMTPSAIRRRAFPRAEQPADDLRPIQGACPHTNPVSCRPCL